MIVNVEGDLLELQKELHLDYICHQVNCQGVMGSGIAKQIRKTYPTVYKNYKEKVDKCNQLGVSPLGNIQFVPLYDNYYGTDFHPQCVNFFSQYEYGYDGEQYTSYDAFWICLNKLKKQIPKEVKIGFPLWYRLRARWRELARNFEND